MSNHQLLTFFHKLTKSANIKQNNLILMVSQRNKKFCWRGNLTKVKLSWSSAVMMIGMTKDLGLLQLQGTGHRWMQGLGLGHLS